MLFETAHAVVAELSAHPDIAVYDVAIVPPPGDEVLEPARRLRVDAALRSALARLPGIRLRWGLADAPDAPERALGGLELASGSELLARVEAARERQAADGKPRFLALDRWPGAAVGFALVRGVLGPRLLLRADGPGILPMPVMDPEVYAQRVLAARGLYLLRTLEAGDPAVLGPLAPVAWAPDRELLDELVTLAGAAEELASGTRRVTPGARPPKTARSP